MPHRVADVMSLNEREAIRDPRAADQMRGRAGLGLRRIHRPFGAAHRTVRRRSGWRRILILISRLEQSDYLASVEWETLLFFAGLFVMVGALVKTGVVAEMARPAIDVTGGDPLLTSMLILGVSAPVSGIIDNIPYVATMTPIVSELAASMPDLVHPDALWWALALGADFGGNLTAVGASANVVMLGIAAPRRAIPSRFGSSPARARW